MDPQFDREHEREERKAPQAPFQADAPDAMQLASHIGNQGVQRVASSRQLQRSPAAAGLVRGRVLARQEDEEPESAPPAAGAESSTEAAASAPEAAGNENAPEAAEAGGNENAEASGNENAAPEEEEAA